MGSAIRDDFIKKSKTKEDFVEEEGSDPLGGDGFLGRAKNDPLSKPMVDHDQERIEARGDREVRDKVTRDLLEGARSDRFNGRQGGCGGVRVNFVLLAQGTAFNIAADKRGESRPPEFSGDQLASFQEAGMAGGLMIMAAFEDGTAEGVVCRDVDTSLVSKDAGFDLPVSEPRVERKRNVLMHGLEGLEDKGITCGSRFDAMREGGVDEVNEKGRWKKGDVSVVGIIRGEKIRAAGKGIRPGEEFPGDVDHFEVKVCQVNEPTRLSAIERLGLSEVGEVLMVSEDLYREQGAVEVMAPGLQGVNDSKEFAIIDIVVTLGRREGL